MFFVPEDIVAAVAWQGSSEGMHVRIPRDEEVSEPILVTITGQGADQRADAHIVIEALENSSATVVLRHRGSAQYAQNVEIIARPGSRLTVITVQRWDDDAVHAASHQARVDKDAYLKHFVISFGGGVVRVNPTIELAGTGSEGRMYGLSYADSGQHLESQVYLHHKGAYTTGDVLYKGALQGASAHSVWIGDVLIGPDATGTDSYEANRNLVLTEGARADSIPNLEIQTGDIQWRRPRQRHGPIRRRAAVLLAGARHRRGGGTSIGRARLPQRRRPAPRHPRPRGGAARRHRDRTRGGERVSAQRACGVNELEQDAPLRVELDGVPIAIVRDSNDEIHAIGDTCTHGEISLSEGFVEGDTLECWAHGSAFSLRTGVPQNLPAFEPVPVYVVEIDGDDVLIDPTVTKEV